MERGTMTFLFVIFCVMLSLMLFPLLLGRYSRDSEGQEPLFIKADNVKNPRYFAKSFRDKLRSALENYPNDKVLHLSKDETVIFADEVEFSPKSEVNEVVLAIQAPLNIPRHCVFQKEIFSEKGVRVGSGSMIRAVAGMENVELDHNVTVVRWVDAEDKLTIHEDCDLGISATAGKRISIASGCTFRRLYAPEICTMDDIVIDSGPQSRHTQDQTSASDKVFRLERVPTHEKLEGSVISNGDLALEPRCEVMQSVHADNNLHISNGSIVRKNVFADGDIIIEDNVTIGGHVFAQKDVFIGSGCRIGTYGQTKSLIARNSITLSQGSVIYSYIGSEKASRVVTKDVFFELISDRF